MKTDLFATNSTNVRYVMFCAAIMLIVSVILLIVDDSQIVLTLFACLQGFGAVTLLWASFSMKIAKRIEQGKDVIVFQRRACYVLLVVGFLPLVAVCCLIVELLSA